MQLPLIIWCSVTGLLVLIVLVNLIHALLFSKQPIFSLAPEREEFYVPGDALHEDDEDVD